MQPENVSRAECPDNRPVSGPREVASALALLRSRVKCLRLVAGLARRGIIVSSMTMEGTAHEDDLISVPPFLKSLKRKNSRSSQDREF